MPARRVFLSVSTAGSTLCGGFVADRGMPPRRADRNEQFLERIEINGLGKMMIESRFARAIMVVGIYVARHCDQHGISGYWMLAQSARHLVAVHPGHADVVQHDVRPAAEGRRQRGLSVVYVPHRVAGEAQHHG